MTTYIVYKRLFNGIQEKYIYTNSFKGRKEAESYIKEQDNLVLFANKNGACMAVKYGICTLKQAHKGRIYIKGLPEIRE